MAQTSQKLAGKFHRLRKARSDFHGIFPVIKPLGIKAIDLLDSIRLSIEFDRDVTFASISTQISGSPTLRKHESGILNVALGDKTMHLLNFKYGSLRAKLHIELGKRAGWTGNNPEVQKFFGIMNEDSSLFKSYKHVTIDQVHDWLSTYPLGEQFQYRAPKEATNRELITERNRPRKPKTETTFREAAPPRKVTLTSIDDIDFTQWPVVTIDMTTCASFCRERFAHELGLRMETYAHLKSAHIYQFETINIQDALPPYNCEWKKINSTIGRTSARYSKISKALEQIGKPVSMRFRCPW